MLRATAAPRRAARKGASVPRITRLAAAVAALAAVQGAPARAQDSGVPPAVEARARVLAARIDALPPGRRKARAEAAAVRELQRLVLREAEADLARCGRGAAEVGPSRAG